VELLTLISAKAGARKAGDRVNRLRTFLLPTGRVHTRLLIVASALIFIVPQVWSQSEPLNDYQVKAAYLYTFTKFVEWPPEVSSDSNAPVVLGIVGKDPFGKSLTDLIAGKSVNGKKVVAKQFKEGQDLRNCQVLFVSTSEKNRLTQILGELNGSSVLTVSEIEGFAQSGGMIALVLENNKVKLEINLEAAARAHLKMSAKMLAVARIVAEGQHGGKS